MSNQETLALLKKVRSEINYTVSPSGSSSVLFSINNWRGSFTALQSLYDVQYLTKYVDSLYAISPFVKSPLNSFNLNIEEKNKFTRSLDNVKVALNVAIDILEKFNPLVSENSLYILMPSNLSMSEFADILNGLDLALNKNLAVREKNDNNDVVISDVSTGSIWIILSVTAASITLIGQMVKMAIGIAHDIQIHKKIEQNLKASSASIDVLEALGETIKKTMDNMCDEQASLLLKGEESGEKINTMSRSFKELSEVFFKGVQIHASPISPKEVLAFFPTLSDFVPFKRDSPAKMLQEHATDEDGDKS
jgi:hypothetical protein